MSPPPGRPARTSVKPGRWPVAAVFAASLAWSLLNYQLYFRGANTYESAHYAEIGRNIAEGRGFRSRVNYPMWLAILDGRGLARMDYPPVLDRFPLPAYLSALFQRLLGPTDFSSLLGTLLLFAAWTAGVFWLGTRWLSPTIGALAALVFATLPALCKYFVLSNLPDVHFGLIFFAFNALLAAWAERPGSRSAAGLGILGGAAFLARTNFWIWLPLHVWILGKAGRRPKEGLRYCAAYLGAFLLTVSPYVFYLLRWFGTPFSPALSCNLAHHVLTQDQPWHSFIVYPLWPILRDHWHAVTAKAWSGLQDFLFEAPGLWQLQVCIPFAALGLWALPAGPARRWAGVNLASLLIQVLAFAPLRFDSWGLGVADRYLIWFAPVAVLAAANGVLRLSEGLRPGWRAAAVAMFLAAQTALTLPFYTRDLAALHLAHPSGRAPGAWPEILALRARLAPGDCVVSNLPAQVAWYANACAIALPNDPEEISSMQRARPLKYLYVSFLSVGTLGDFPAWASLLTPSHEGFERLCEEKGWRILRVYPGAGVLADLSPA